MNDPMHGPEAQASLAGRLRAAIGDFLVEFAALESLWLGAALRSLLVDQQLVDQLGELTDLSQRLKLLDRMAEARGASPLLLKDVKHVTNGVREILEVRNDIAHNIAVITAASELVAGVRKRASKRKLPTKPITTAEQFKRFAESGMHTLPQIEAYTRQVADLQRSMLGIAERLDKHRRGITAANV